MPPPDTIPRLTDSDGVSPRVRRGFNQMADALNSLLRSTELQRTKANEWTVGGSGSTTGTLELSGFFPRFLPGPVAYLTAPNTFLAPQSIVTTSAPVLTLYNPNVFASDATVFQVTGPLGSPVFVVDTEGDVFGGDASFDNGVFTGSVLVGGTVTATTFVGSGTGLTGVALLAAANTFTLGPNQFRTGGNANVGVQIRQNSSSQSANLFELTDSTGATVLASFSKNCALLTMPATFAIGAGAGASSGSAVALGQFATASGSTGTALGFSSTASGSVSVAVGSTAVASKTAAIAIGSNASASATSAVAIGNTASAAFSNAFAFGGGAALAADEMVYGTLGITATGHFRLTGALNNTARSMFRLTTSWIDSTDSTRLARAVMGVNDFNTLTTPREGLRFDSNGTGCTTIVGADSTFQGLVVNDAGADADTRVEGDTATQLLVCDAGLDAVQIGTTTAGVIADFRSATIVFNENGADRDFRVEGDTDANLLFTDASTDRVGVKTNAPGSDLDVAGSLQCDSITNDTGLAHGTYTPTRSAEANLDANVTPSQAQYSRVGNVVTVSGRFTADPTLAATPTSFELSLPVASNIGAAEDLAGVAFCGTIAGQGAAVTGSVANNTAVFTWVSGDITSQTWSYTYSYRVI